MTIHKNLRQLRMNCGLTQEQVAQQIGVTRQALSGYESGRTRPDIETLTRLGEIYGTDLEGILYGKDRSLTEQRRVGLTAKITLILFPALSAVSSALLLTTNHFFPLPLGGNGIFSVDQKLLLETRQKFLGAWEFIDTIALTLGEISFLLLLIFLLLAKKGPSLKKKLAFVGLFAAAMLAPAALFGVIDPVYPTVNYTTTPFLIVVDLLFFFLLELIIGFFIHRRRNKCAE